MPDTEPRIGDLVHYLSPHVGCIPASVTSISPTGAVTLNAPPGSRDRLVMEGVEHDPMATAPSTWHWPEQA